MQAVIVANGELNPSARLTTLWQTADLRIAADGGARLAREHLGLPPQVVIGDFDSLDNVTAAWLSQTRVEMFQRPRAKDETDLELALALALERGATRMTLLGVLGGRVDQTLANVLLLSRAPRVLIADGELEMWIGDQGSADITGQIGDIVSLVPLSDQVEDIVTEELAFSLHNETLIRGTTRGISNEMKSTHARVRFGAGTLLIIHLFKHGHSLDD